MVRLVSEATDVAPQVTEVREYDGQPAVCIEATQLDLRFSVSRARQIVAEWVEFFCSGPTPITDLTFVSRTPKRLFDALSGQTQLVRLAVKWGDYDDLGALVDMQSLTFLRLRGASSLRDLAPLGRLAAVRCLDIESLRHVRDLSPIGDMPSVESLRLGGSWMSDRIVHVNSIGFLRKMPQLKRLFLHTMIVDDLDYTPVRDLPRLEAVAVMKARGMRPPIEELIAATPWVV
jgi:hypothetical protein